MADDAAAAGEQPISFKIKINDESTVFVGCAFDSDARGPRDPAAAYTPAHAHPTRSFKVKKSAKLEKVFAAWHTKTGTAPGSIRFTLEGKVLSKEDTVKQAEINEVRPSARARARVCPRRA